MSCQCNAQVLARSKEADLLKTAKMATPNPDWVTIINCSVTSLLYARCYTVRRACVCLRQIHTTPACSISRMQLFYFFFASNTRNTRGVTKGVHCGHAPNVHHAKYEYPPDDTIHVLPGGRHTWSTVRRWNASSHLHDAALLGCVS